MRKQIGSCVNGRAAGDYYGFSVALSDDGTVVVIGAPFNDDTGSDSGPVRVFKLNGDEWLQLGMDISGERANDRFGSSVALSADCMDTVVAISAA